MLTAPNSSSDGADGASTTINSARIEAVTDKYRGMSRMAHLKGSLRSKTEYFTDPNTSAAKPAATKGAIAHEAAICAILDPTRAVRS